MHRVLALLFATLLFSESLALTAAPPRPESALMLLPTAWQELGYEIVFLPPQAGYRAMTFPAKHRIEIYARPQDNLDLLAFDIAHELGHAIDVKYNTTETRKQWMQLRGIDPATSWFGCDRCSDYNTPAGDFAESFALLLFGPKYFRGRIAAKPAADDLLKMAAFFPKDFVPSIAVIGN